MICSRNVAILPLLGGLDGTQRDKQRQPGHGMSVVQTPVGCPVNGYPTKAAECSEDSKRSEDMASVGRRCFANRCLKRIEFVAAIDALRPHPCCPFLIRNWPVLRGRDVQQRPI